MFSSQPMHVSLRITKLKMNNLASLTFIVIASTAGFTIFGTTNATKDFAAGGDSELKCISERSCSKSQCPGWSGLNINAMEATTFRVRIGTSGGTRGYPSITGLSGRGIAYFINDTMIPVLRLRRNVTYTFIVEAGNDPNDGPNYHPFYITDSEDGGILLDTPEQRMRKNEQVFAALDLDTDRPTAAGRLCEHIETEESAAVAEDCNSELQEYLDTLNVTCEGNETSAAILTWTPDENTPDIVYYQSATHIHLGWKIIFNDEPITSGSGLDESVTDSPDEPSGSGIDPPTSLTSPTEAIDPTDTVIIAIIDPTDTVTINPTDTAIIDPTDTVTINPTNTDPTDTAIIDPTDIVTINPTNTVTTETVTTETVTTDPDEPTGSITNSNSGNQVTASGSHLIILMILVLTLSALMN